MKTKIKTKRRIAFCGVAAVFLLTLLLNFVWSKQRASATTKEYDLTDRSPSNSYELTPEFIGTWAMPYGYTSAQSFAINGSHYIVVASPKGGNRDNTDYNKILLINRNNNQEVTSNYGNPQHKMGHGNGATWDSKNKQLLVVDGKNVYRFDEDYDYIDTKSTLNSNGVALNASGIAYDNLNGQYWTSSGDDVRKINMNTWKASTMVTTTHTQVNQDLGYYHGYVYRPLWAGNSGDYTYRYGNFSPDNGVIMQFGDDGTFTGAFYTTWPSCELESVAFASDEMYLLYNNCDNGSRSKGYYTIAKVSDSSQLKTMYHRFEVKFDANGGSGAPASYKTHVGIPSKISKTEPTRGDDYKFLGWSTNKNATTAESKYAPGSTFVRNYSNLSAVSRPKAESDVTLYAVWQEKKYTVSYNANGGKGAPASQTAGKSQDITLSSTEPTRTNYTFVGWSTSKTATTESYHAGDRFTNHENTTLYAVWRADTYTVRYNATGGTGAPSSQSAVKTADLTLSSTAPARHDFDFKGWATAAGGAVDYQPGDRYTGRADITLYAVWSVRTYTISFNANGGSGAPSTMQVAKPIPSVKIPSTRPTRDGYEFQGWATSSGSTEVAYRIGDSYTDRSNITLYAVWEENSSTPTTTTIEINYDANGGKNAPATTVGEPGTITLSSDTPTRDGYDFSGWATTSDATTETYKAGATAEFNTDTLLYAVWTRGMITLSYDANDGSGAPASHSGAIGEITVSTTEPTRDGYDFDGWAISSGESVSYKPGDLYRGSVSRKLYAVWSQQTVNINYYFCKSIANPVSSVQKVVSMRRATIPTEEPSRKAYRFLGWSTTGCMGTAEYDPGDSIYIRNNDVNLYAVWIDARFTIHFDVNGGSTDSFDDIIGDDNDVVIPEYEPYWEGYSFVGWDENPDATTATYQPGDVVNGETDMTLFAIWEKNETGSDPDNSDNSEDDYGNTDFDDPSSEPESNDPSSESESNNPKTSVSSIIGPISILPIGAISFMVIALRRRRS